MIQVTGCNEAVAACRLHIVSIGTGSLSSDGVQAALTIVSRATSTEDAAARVGRMHFVH